MAGKESLKSVWIEKIKEINPGQDYITPKQLAGIIDTSYSKIYAATINGLIKGVIKMGPPSISCEIRISKWAAIEYVESFQE